MDISNNNNTEPCLKIKQEPWSEDGQNRDCNKMGNFDLLIPMKEEVDDPELEYDNAEPLSIDHVKKEYVEEQDNNEKDNSLMCKVCKNIFPSTDHVRIHRAVPSLQKTFDCCSCGKRFRDMSQLNVHCRIHTGERPYACPYCQKQFTINGNLTKHIRTHTNERRFECDRCERKFIQFAHLEDHLKTHTGERPFECDQCDAAFTTKSRRKKHMRTHEIVDNAVNNNYNPTIISTDKRQRNILRCSLCNKRFRSHLQLAKHMPKHSDDPLPYKCVECIGREAEEGDEGQGQTDMRVAFQNYQQLQHHMKSVHVNLKHLACDICNKMFTASSHLRRHMRAHTGIRPYRCDVCGRCFPSTQNMKRHVMTHTGEKPHQCPVCEKPFLSQENMIRHQRTHTKEKPYTCTLCERSFAHSTSLKDHKLLHTGEKSFKCLICNKMFALRKLMYRHMRTKHQEGNHSKSHFVKIKSEPIETMDHPIIITSSTTQLKIESDSPENVVIKSEYRDENTYVQ